MSELNSQEIRKQASEMEALAKNELRGDAKAADQFDRKMVWMEICGPQFGVPWTVVEKEMKADYDKNVQRHDMGMPNVDRSLPQITLVNDVERSNTRTIVFAVAPYQTQQKNELSPVEHHPWLTRGGSNDLYQDYKSGSYWTTLLEEPIVR